MVVEGLGVVVARCIGCRRRCGGRARRRRPLGVGERHPQRVEDEVGAHVRGELPADDLAAVDVDDEAKNTSAFPAAQVGEVRDPELVAAGGAEVALRRGRAAAAPRVRGSWCATACRGAWRLGSRCVRISRCDPVAADLLAGAHAAPSTSGGSRRRSSWRRAARGSGRAAARPRRRRASAGRWRAGSRRTPTRPGSGRSARPRSAPRCSSMNALTSVGAGRAPSRKTRDAAFKISLARRSSKFSLPQALDLLALLSRRQIRTQPLVRLDLAHALAQRLRTAARDPPRRARSDGPTRTPAASPRSNNSDRVLPRPRHHRLSSRRKTRRSKSPSKPGRLTLLPRNNRRTRP